jgi:hypothetical protein
MIDMKRSYGFKELLTSNAKLIKGPSTYSVLGLTLAPHRQSGRNVCPEAGYCAEMCVLWFAGRMVQKATRQAAIARTKLFFDERETFLALLSWSIVLHSMKCGRQDIKPCVRLNTASDLSWEKIDLDTFVDRPEVTFYDYTKVRRRALDYVNGKMPANYHLTYSVSERSDPKFVRELLELGANVAVVVDSPWVPSLGIVGRIPKSMSFDGKRFQTVDGDKHDLRIPELDGRGKVIVLRSKGGIVKALEGVASKFVRRVRGGRFQTHELAA